MSSSIERFAQRAAERGVEVETRAFPAGTRTAVDAAAAIGCEVAEIVKSLVFITSEGVAVLALTSGANRVDVTVLAADLGVDEVRQATAAEVREATGYAIGGTPPFGHETALTVVCDRELTRHELVWAAAGSPTHVFPISPQQLLAVTGAPVLDLAASG